MYFSLFAAWILSASLPVLQGYIVHLPTDKQTELLFNKLVECYMTVLNETPTLTGEYCNRTWDTVMCWPDTKAGTTLYQPCPDYVNGFETRENASRTCLPNGTWYIHPDHQNQTSGWTNLTSCSTIIPATDDLKDVPDLLRKHLGVFLLMYNTGYGLSLASLIVAVGIMVYFKKLHCSRNTIHLNLFASLILRAAISLLRDNLLVQGLGFPKDVSYMYRENDTEIYFRDDVSHWECRLFFTVFQYVIAASYVWIFVEAVYLHMLIFVSVFTEKSHVLWYMILGWFLPLPFVIAWGIARSMVDNTLCWNTSTSHPGLPWIINGPIVATIVINFFFFINIVRVLCTKLNSSPYSDSRRFRYRRLAKSTLVLIPLFGVYYFLFVFTQDVVTDTAEFVLLFVEMFFNSYQGLVIAVVLCFGNTEVRNEFKKVWKRRTMRRASLSRVSNIPLQKRKSQTSQEEERPANRSLCCQWSPRTHAHRNASSVGDIEESYPLSTSVKTYSVVMNGGLQRDYSTKRENESCPSSESTENFVASSDGETIGLKINFVNIQHDSKDGKSSVTTAVDIEQTGDDGKVTKSYVALNNNKQFTSDNEVCKSDQMAFMDEDAGLDAR